VGIYFWCTNQFIIQRALGARSLEHGRQGSLLAALAAAILSSLETIFNSAATLFTMDFVKHFYPRLSEAALVRTGKAATIGFMLW
jgi:solute:Na+ symporter, SSS family